MEEKSKAYSDEELVARCQKELPFDSNAFEILVDRYKNQVFATAYKILQHRQNAEDVAQDVFVKLFRVLPKHKIEKSFAAWLYAVTKNTCFGYLELKQNKIWRWISEDIDDWRHQSKIDEHMLMLVIDGMEQKELGEKIRRILSKMNPLYEEILLLRFYEDLDYKSIAERLNISMSATKMRLKRAKEAFLELHPQNPGK